MSAIVLNSTFVLYFFNNDYVSGKRNIFTSKVEKFQMTFFDLHQARKTVVSENFCVMPCIYICTRDLRMTFKGTLMQIWKSPCMLLFI